MANKLTVLQGVTEFHYHSVPNELAMVTLSPERESIFNHLSVIGHNRFPEFIQDILVHVMGHKLVDITDGPGDEKQDILTVNSSGERQLTQCKHTVNYNDHYSGNELDLLFGACCRKNCTKALFVTNSDLTPQAKRYITDKEFARGWKGPVESLPHIDYWNSHKIWGHIATNNAILNKWFSGMGQVHGLRNFYFDLIIQELPSGDTFSKKCSNIAFALKEKGIIVGADEKKKSFQVKIDNQISFTIEDWFHSDIDLGVPYVGPQTEHDLANIPLWALRIRASISSEVGQYDPARYRDLIVKTICDNALTLLPNTKWWYLVATTPQAFIYLQDIVEPKVVSISQAETYVMVENESSVEKDWTFLNGDEFNLIDDETLGWCHVPTEINVYLMLEQRPHPIAAYEQKIRNYQIAQKISKYDFKVIEKITNDVVDRVRRIIDQSWVLMVLNERDLLLAHPPTVPSNKIQKIKNALATHDISLLYMRDEDRDKLLKSSDVMDRTNCWMYVSSTDQLVTPIWLNKRLIWLEKEVAIDPPKDLDIWIKLLKYKAEHEAEYGFNFMGDKEETKLASEEIEGFLYDFFSFRGKRMLDISFDPRSASINYRIKIDSLEPTTKIISEYIQQFQKLINDIVGLCEVN